MRNITLNTLNEVKDFLLEKFDTEKTLVESDTTITLPSITDYFIGYKDIFQLENYPSIVIGFDTIENDERNEFVNVSVDVVLIIMEEDNDLLNSYGLLYSDVLTNLFSTDYKLNNRFLNTEIKKVEHFIGDDKYIIDINIEIEIEVKND